MFDLLLTDDPANWPWTAFFNLPTLTLTLIGSRLHAVPLSTLIPVLFAWPLSTPVGTGSRLLSQYWSDPENARKLSLTSIASPSIWPPSPAVFAFFMVPVTRMLYNHCFSYLHYWTLGARPSTPARRTGQGWQVDEGFFIRIRANVVNENDPLGQEQQAQVPQQQVPAPDVAPADQEPNAAAVAAAEQLISFDTSSLGRKVGGALLIPAISNMMGSFLFQLSKRSTLLRRFLGVRPPLSGVLPPPLGSYSVDKSWHNLSLVRQLGLSIRLVMNATWNGTRTWAEADPVWYVFLSLLMSKCEIN